ATVTYTDNGLTPGTRYDYHVQAFNLAGYSDFAGATATTVTLPPTNLRATPGTNQVALSWTAPAGAVTFSVYRGATPGGEGATPIAIGLTTPAYTDAGLATGQYYYVVTATDRGGESARSAEASAAVGGA